MNYLDYIPVSSDKITFDVTDGQVTVYKENKGIFNRAAQKLFKKPKVTQIHLDKLGSFVWTSMDGQRNIYDIAQLVKDEFGDDAEPLYDRIIQYFKSLSECSFVTYLNIK